MPGEERHGNDVINATHLPSDYKVGDTARSGNKIAFIYGASDDVIVFRNTDQIVEYEPSQRLYRAAKNSSINAMMQLRTAFRGRWRKETATDSETCLPTPSTWLSRKLTSNKRWDLLSMWTQRLPKRRCSGRV